LTRNFVVIYKLNNLIILDEIIDKIIYFEKNVRIHFKNLVCYTRYSKINSIFHFF